MPELPEVETIRKSVKPHLLEKRVQNALFYRSDILRGSEDCPISSAQEFTKGKRIRDVGRCGKYLILMFQGGEGWAVHFGMSGTLSMSEVSGSTDKHTHVVLHLEDGSYLNYRAPRRFGHWLMCKGSVDQALNKKIGKDALSGELDSELFTSILGGSRARIKSRLLDQGLIAGLGNIYTDESLFRAQIHPIRPADSLKKKEWEDLHESVTVVLREAIDNCGTTFDAFRDGRGQPGENSVNLRVYGREGESCTRCEHKVQKIKVVGRGTHICPGCQQ